jgi:hypothetical protein
MPDLSGRQTSSAQAWFGAGERVGYDPKARAMVAAQDAPLEIFLSREGDVAQAVSAWISERLIRVGESSAAFAERCRDAETLRRLCRHGRQRQAQGLRYSTAERTDLVEAIWRDLAVQSTPLVAFDFSSLGARSAASAS